MIGGGSGFANAWRDKPRQWAVVNCWSSAASLHGDLVANHQVLFLLPLAQKTPIVGLVASGQAASEPGKVTVPMLRTLDLLLSQPTRDDWFALQIVRDTKLGSGTVVQILFRLERWGWVVSRWEDVGYAHDHRRPRRKFYRLTGTGARKARQFVEGAMPRLLRLRPA